MKEKFEARKLAAEIRGLSEEEAKKKLDEKGIRYRVVSRNGEHYMLTADYDISRLNLVIEDDKVTAYSFG